MFSGFSGKKDEATRACEPTVASNATPNCTRSFALNSNSLARGASQALGWLVCAWSRGVTFEVAQ